MCSAACPADQLFSTGQNTGEEDARMLMDDLQIQEVSCSLTVVNHLHLFVCYLLLAI